MSETRFWKERSTGHIVQADRMPFPRFSGDYWDECNANGETAHTPSAYSVEEHMFNQDEIQRRHPPTTEK